MIVKYELFKTPSPIPLEAVHFQWSGMLTTKIEYPLKLLFSSLHQKCVLKRCLSSISTYFVENGPGILKSELFVVPGPTPLEVVSFQGVGMMNTKIEDQLCVVFSVLRNMLVLRRG